MKREHVPVRGWDQIDELDRGNFYHLDGRAYWLDDVAYIFTPAEIEKLHAAAAAMVTCVNAAVAQALNSEGTGALDRLAIPPALHGAVKRSWARRDPTLYGRFDFVLDQDGTPKFLEFNADTPTALFEAAVMQWRWLQARDPNADQYNRIHEKLCARFRELGAAQPAGSKVHFACMRAERDDRLTADYLRDCAVQAGLKTEALDMVQLGVKGPDLVDLHEEKITHLFKLYPWEWLGAETFAGALIDSEVGVLEPCWRLAASSKMLLADLWTIFPEHPNLVPAAHTIAPHEQDAYLAKDAFGREGDSVYPARTPPRGPCAYQKRVDVRPVEGRYPVLGVWIVGDEPCGLGVREDVDPITDHDAFFVPHRIAEQ